MKKQTPRAAWLDLYRAALIEACGYASILGLDADAQKLYDLASAAENPPEPKQKNA